MLGQMHTLGLLITTLKSGTFSVDEIWLEI